MKTNYYCERILNRFAWLKVDLLEKRTIRMDTTTPFISFTFDDFPTSSYLIGGTILKNYGLRGTYYISFGMMGEKASSGVIADLGILENLLSDGHELGCHTYTHADAWRTAPDIFETSISENQRALSKYFPGNIFKTFAFPYRRANPSSKRIAGKYFTCCRGGRQKINKGRIDLNYVYGYSIDKYNNNSITSIKKMIDKNSDSNGWLIFYTHDIDGNPSPGGCTPSFFEEIVEYAQKSNAVILPVSGVLESLLVT